MADLTVYAEALIAVTARAFYDDEVVCLIDVLLRDKYLRDDDMGPRLQLPAKKLRATLQFLTDEHLVRSELVDDLEQGGSQNTKFYYLDYCRAVHSIRWRVHLLQNQLKDAERQARSSSFYYCPGYKDRRCNGRYTEEEAQQVLDDDSGLFLCRECAQNYLFDPHSPPKATYTLQLVDNTAELRRAMDHLRRVTVQLSAKFIGNQQLRAGVYDLLQKVRGGSKGGGARGGGAPPLPITSNLPSENFQLGVGSQRLAGTGRTWGQRVQKLQEQGVAASAEQAKSYLVSGSSSAGGRVGGGLDGDLLFLKNALGYEMQFTVEKGGGARAQVLASKRRRRRKLLDAAASRVGAALPLYLRVEESRKRKRQAEAREQQEQEKKGGRKLMKAGATLDFLHDNIGRNALEDRNVSPAAASQEEEEEVPELEVEAPEHTEIVLVDDTEDLRQFSDETRLISFQSQYQMEVDRQSRLLQLPPEPTSTSLAMSSPTSSAAIAAGRTTTRTCRGKMERSCFFKLYMLRGIQYNYYFFLPQ